MSVVSKTQKLIQGPCPFFFKRDLQSKYFNYRSVCVVHNLCVCVCVYVCVCARARSLHCGWHFFRYMKIKYAWNRVIQADRVSELHLTCLLCNLAFSISPTICLTPPPVPLAISAHFLTLLSGTLLIHPPSSTIYIYMCVCVCVCVCVMFCWPCTISNISIMKPTRYTFVQFIEN
jgi:hypothetical protein